MLNREVLFIQIAIKGESAMFENKAGSNPYGGRRCKPLQAAPCPIQSPKGGRNRRAAQDIYGQDPEIQTTR